MKQLPVWPVAAVAVLVAILTWSLTDWWGDRQWRGRYVDAVNAAAEADQLRLIAEGDAAIYERRMKVARDESELAELELAEERDARRRAGLRIRQLTNIVASLEARLEGETVATTTGDTTRLEIDATDGPIRVTGTVKIAGVVDPPDARAIYVLRAVAQSIGLRVRVVEDDAGVPRVQVTSLDPDHVRIGMVDATIDLDRTGLVDDEQPGRLKWAAIGGGVTAVALTVLRFLLGE